MGRRPWDEQVTTKGAARRRSLIGKVHMQQKRFSVTDMADPHRVTMRRNRGSVIAGIEKFRNNRMESDAAFQWAPDNEIQSTKHVEPEMLMEFETGGTDDIAAYAAEGDEEMESEENVKKRSDLRTNPEIVKVLETFYSTCGSSRKHGHITCEEYIWFHMRVAKALFHSDVFIDDSEYR
jgi:hypothetical protein